MEFTQLSKPFLLMLSLAVLMSPVVSAISISSLTLASQRNTDHLLPSQNLLDPPDVEIQCILHHEFAVFVHPDEVSNFYPRDGIAETSQIPPLRSYVNQNGKTKMYFCSPCSRCGEGVRILTQCHLRQDIVCSNLCINPSWMYDSNLKICYSDEKSDPTTIASRTTAASEVVTFQRGNWTTSAWITGAFRYITSNSNPNLNNAEKEPGIEHKKSYKWKEIIPVTVGVLTLNVMLAVLLVWKRRDLKRKKAAQKCIQQEQERRNQNNSTVTSGSEQNRTEHSDAILDIESEIPPSVSLINGVDANVLSNHTTSTRRVKESNLNQYVDNFQSGIESQTEISAPVFQSQIAIEPEIHVQPGTNPYWLEMSGYFGPQGGILSCDQSDVVVEIPPGAIPTSHLRQLIVVRVSRTLGTFPIALSKDALFLSPLVECESPGLKMFEKDVVIKLPHRAHLGPDWKFTVHYTGGSSADETAWSTVTTSYQDLQNTTHVLSKAKDPSESDVRFTIDEKYVHIATPHFSQYTCSGCGKKRELSLETVVYLHHIHLEKERRVDLHCYLLDSIKDFQSKVDHNEAYRPRSEHKPIIIDAKKGKELEVSLVDMGEHWPWRVDERIHKTVQSVPLASIVRCHSDAVPFFATFILRTQDLSRTEDNISDATFLEAAVSIKQKSRVHTDVIVDIALNLDELDSTDCEQSGKQGKGKEVKKTGLQEIFMDLSSKITAKEWRPLYRCLMTSTSGCPLNVEADISFIETKDPHDVKEQIYQGFLKWLSMAGKNATCERLCNSLRQVELVALAEEIEDTYRKQDGKTIKAMEETKLLIDADKQNNPEVFETDL